MSSAPADTNNQLCDDQTSAPARHQHPQQQRKAQPHHHHKQLTTRRQTRATTQSSSAAHHPPSSSSLSPSSSSASSSKHPLSTEQQQPQHKRTSWHHNQSLIAGRLTKTHNSAIYFSDSDDVDSILPAPAASAPAPATTKSTIGTNTDGDDAYQPLGGRGASASPTSYQQQNYRRHRQFHRTFTPFDLRTFEPQQQPTTEEEVLLLLDGGEEEEEEEDEDDIDDNHRHLHSAIPEESTDENDNANDANNDYNTAAVGGHAQRVGSASRLRESPAHQRYKQQSGGVGPKRRSVSRSPTKRGPRRAEVADRRSMLLSYGPETICVLALILTTFATFQNDSPKLSRVAAAPPFFPAGSLVHDYPAGNLDFVQTRVKAADISLVLFYAPWSADCQHARTTYEQTARLFYRHVYFAAVNCWQPGGECRSQYAKIHEWPVAMAYFQTGPAVPYSGLWSTASLVRFVRALHRPLQRVIDNDDMLRLMMSHDAVVVAFLDEPDSEDGRTYYDSFYATAIKWLQRDPHQSVAFAVVTGAGTQSFGVQRPLVRVYQWNGTVEHEFSDGWQQTRMYNWIAAQIIRVSTWLQPPGTKATTLAPHFQAGPVLMLFTPRNAIAAMPAANDAYDMLRQIALGYSNCASVNQPWIAEMARVYITHVRSENRRAHGEFVAECGRMREAAESAARAEAKCRAGGGGVGRDGGGLRDQRQRAQQQQHVSSIVFGNVVNSSKLPLGVAALHRCTIGPRNVNDMCEVQQEEEESGEGQTCAKPAPAADDGCSVRSGFESLAMQLVTSMLDPATDERSPQNLRAQHTRKMCELHLAGEELSDFPRAEFFEVAADEWQSFERIAEMGCAANRSLSFVAVDSALYHVFAERLGVDVLRREGRTAAVIVDHEWESAYVHDGPITTNSLTEFVHNYTLHKLPRHLKVESDAVHDQQVRHRRVELPPTASSAEFPPRVHAAIELRSIDSQSFAANVMQSNKTVFVLFHSLQCALCVPMTHSLLMTAHMLADLRTHVDIVRIDGDRNDLPWQYTVDRLPALIAFPPGARQVESRSYPSALAATMPNVLSFVLANLERPVRLHGMVLVCAVAKTKFGLSADCARTIRTEIRDDIAFSLRQWRKLPHMRGGIVRRLQALQRLLLQMHRSDADGATLLELVLSVRKVWPTVIVPA